MSPITPIEPPRLSPAPRRRSQFWKRLGTGALVAILAGFGVATFTEFGRDTKQALIKWGPGLFQSSNLLFDRVGQNHVNILLIGQDRNWKVGKVFDPTVGKMRSYQVIDTSVRSRADTMIVCSLDRATRKVKLVSFPRDTRVQYVDFKGRIHPAGARNYVKLNSVFARPDGEKLLPKVIHDELGIRVDRVVKVKLEGFTTLIDRVGGIDINVEGGLFNGKRGRMTQEDKWGGWKVDLMPGMQHLNAEQAHGYVRYRKDNEGDPGRVRRQQQVMRALAKKMMHINPFQLPGLVTELDKLFVSNLSDAETVSAAKFVRSLGDPSKITPITPFGIYAGNDIILNKPQNVKLFKAIFGSSFDPKHFLVLSPETTRDTIGARNNNNPASRAVLEQLGIIAQTEDDSKSANVEAPGLQ